MPVNTPHPRYSAHEKQWKRCRDAVDGSDAVKAAGAEYLPGLSEQTTAEYDAYRMRALWYGASARTIQGLTGAVMRKDPVVTLPEGLKPFLLDVTSSGVPFASFAMTALDEVLKSGRYGVLVDMPVEMTDRQLPYFSAYIAESIVNWTTTVLNGIPTLTQVVLKECDWVRADDDPYVMVPVEQYRVLRLKEGRYEQEIFREATSKQGKWISQGIVTPTIRGAVMDFIPFCIFGPRTMTPDIEKPPILDLVDVNFSHYRSSADLEHGRHFCGLPTPWVAGFPETAVLKIGSSVAWVSNDPNASAGMLEFTGQGLGALETALESKEKLMAVLGARLLEEQKPSVEAADTVTARMSGEQSVLRAVANTVSQGLSQLLQWTARWTGMGPEEAKKVTAQLNTDLMSSPMSFAELTQLVTAWQAGAMSFETMYYNMQRGEVTRPGVDWKKEKAQIEKEAPAIIPLGDPNLDQEDPELDSDREPEKKKGTVEV